MYLGNGTTKNIFSLPSAKETGLLYAKETRVSDDLIYQTTAKELRMRKETLMKFVQKGKRSEGDILSWKCHRFATAKETCSLND